MSMAGTMVSYLIAEMLVHDTQLLSTLQGHLSATSYGSGRACGRFYPISQRQLSAGDHMHQYSPAATDVACM